MRKKIFWKVFLFILISITTMAYVEALEFCPQKITDVCLIITPSLSCGNITDYTYQIMDEDGTIVQYRNLTLWNQSQYSFIMANFSSGDYMVRLCDNSTRELIVMADLTYINGLPEGISNTINLNTGAGITILIVLLAIWFIFFITALAMRNGIFVFLLGIYTIILGIALCFVISVVAGILLILMGLGFLGWGYLIAKSK